MQITPIKTAMTATISTAMLAATTAVTCSRQLACRPALSVGSASAGAAEYAVCLKYVVWMSSDMGQSPTMEIGRSHV